MDSVKVKCGYCDTTLQNITSIGHSTEKNGPTRYQQTCLGCNKNLKEQKVLPKTIYLYEK